ncbi:MAG: 6-carboxytetrahydropterin synthase [Alphaproteobacteria bacterium]|nr:6-carboxytetrahydropterin synthase [Alphaproteobacteria bacterium]
MLYLTRIETFNAAHKLFNPELSDLENDEIYGICANKNWHGHNYELYVTIKGKVNPKTGFIFDLKKLSQFIQMHVIKKYDHKNLNLDVPTLQNILCSTENIALAIWNDLEIHLPEGVKLHAIKLYETNKNYVEYYGE